MLVSADGQGRGETGLHRSRGAGDHAARVRRAGHDPRPDARHITSPHRSGGELALNGGQRHAASLNSLVPSVTVSNWPTVSRPNSRGIIAPIATTTNIVPKKMV